MTKPDINDIPLSELPKVIKELGLKSFTASQIIQWIYKKGATSFAEMTNLSKEARALLEEHFTFGRFSLVKTLESEDGTKKFAWKLNDGHIIESVMIPSESHEKASTYGQCKVPKDDWRKRLTLCVSTQVGCAMGCTFCRTSKLGFVRNLTSGEIIGQILETERSMKDEGRKTKKPVHVPSSILPPADSSLNTRISNVVLMGMGEPLANYDNVLESLKVMLDTKCLGLSRRHVTLSTCGLVPEIERFAKDNPGAKLAISLNATTDEQRQKTMPINKKYPLIKLFAALKKYSKETGKQRITFEYVMIADFNDSIEDAKRLVKWLSQFPSKVNLIPLNSVDENTGSPSDASIQRFAQYLRNKHIQVNIRTSRGQDILAACGQLAGS